jgi:toxin FitB
MSGPQYLLDTNVISELRKKQPERRVVSFLSSTNSASVFLSVLSLGELHKGASLKRSIDYGISQQLIAWIDGIEVSFADRILGVDAAISKVWGDLSAKRSRPAVDTLIAATALVHNLTFVTRSTRDVGDIPHLKTLNPWKD